MEAEPGSGLALATAVDARPIHHLQHPRRDSPVAGMLHAEVFALDPEQGGIDLALFPQAPQQRLNRLACWAALQFPLPWGRVEQHRCGGAQLPVVAERGMVEPHQPQRHLNTAPAVKPAQLLQGLDLRLGEGLRAQHLQRVDRPIALVPAVPGPLVFPERLAAGQPREQR